MIDEVKISSNRGQEATCRGCNKKIERFAIRGIQRSHPFNNYFCEECSELQLRIGVKNIKDTKKEFDRFKNMSREERIDYLYKLRVISKLE